MIVKIDEIGKKMEKRMKEMWINTHIVHLRTGIAESSLSDFFCGIVFKRYFNQLEKIANVPGVTSLTIIFKRNISKKVLHLVK